MPKPKKPRRRKDTVLYMSALQMMVGTPAPATIKAAQVEMLNEPNRVPPYAGANLPRARSVQMGSSVAPQLGSGADCSRGCPRAALSSRDQSATDPQPQARRRAT